MTGTNELVEGGRDLDTIISTHELQRASAPSGGQLRPSAG